MLVSESVFVPAGDRDGVSTIGTVVEGAVYRLRVTGSYSYGAGHADAECSTAAGGTEWKRKAYHHGAAQDYYDLFLNRGDNKFHPVGAPAGSECSPQHVYTSYWTASRAGHLHLQLMLPSGSQPAGGVTVEIGRL